MSETTRVTGVLRFRGSLVAVSMDDPIATMVEGDASSAVIALPKIANPNRRAVIVKLGNVITGDDARFNVSAPDDAFPPLTIEPSAVVTDAAVVLNLADGAADLPGDVNFELEFDTEFAE